MRLIEILKSKNLKLAAAESCTGGAFMAALVRVPGTSEVLCGGMVAYCPDTKVNLLGVKRATIERHGVVSQEVAKEMAEGVKAKLGSDIGIGITGFAGPTGERVGEVCFAMNGLAVTKNFTGTRCEVIDASVDFLVEWLCENI